MMTAIVGSPHWRAGSPHGDAEPEEFTMRDGVTFGTLVIFGLLTRVAAVKADEEKVTPHGAPAAARSERKAACTEGTPPEAEKVSRGDGVAREVVALGDKAERELALDRIGDLVEDEGAVSEERAWTTTFTVNEADLSPTGRNPYFILEPGYQLHFEGREDGKPVTLTISVLDETKEVGKVTTRVVEERETTGGRVVEISRNYFAICKRTNNVYYFGEDVDIYRDGRVVGHEGSWLAGEGGARFGLAMPGSPLLGARYHQEFAPKRAMDRAEVVSLSETIETPPASSPTS
jgi:hypothetical protein